MTNENPYKMGDKVKVVYTIAYGGYWNNCVGTVSNLFSSEVTRYCVWVEFDSDPFQYDWPFMLEEVTPYSPMQGSM